MTPEQLRAHNILTHTLWPEWEEFCRQWHTEGSRMIVLNAWERAVHTTFGQYGRWCGSGGKLSADEDYEVAGEYYAGIRPLDLLDTIAYNRLCSKRNDKK